MAKIKTIEEKYQEMSEREHILERSGMWIGSTKEEEAQMFLYNRDTAKMELKDVTYIPGMLKLVDEIISNSCDEYRRKDNLGLNKIEVSVALNGTMLSVYDNGGIPVVKHKTAGCYVPEFIFGRLRTSSNYDDTEDRNVVGTNGVGSSLSNVFSKSFIVETADKKNSIAIKWHNNMEECIDHGTPKKTKEHFTKTTFELDFSRFDTQNKFYTEEFVEILHKRCIDAAVANPGIEVIFNVYDKTFSNIEYSETWKFDKFDEYIDLYSEYADNDNFTKDLIYFGDSQKKVWVSPCGNLNIGFVNGAECSKGTHIRAVRNEINQSINEYLLKKEKIDVGTRGIDSKYSMFIIIDVVNPAYNSQTKSELTTPVSRFTRDESKFEVPKKFLDEINKSEIINTVLDWYKQKSAAEDAKIIRQLNKQSGKGLKRPDKYITCSSKVKKNKQLWIFEGDSAKSGFRGGRVPDIQAAYMMRGVPMNTFNMSPLQIMKNEVFSDLVNILGLKWGKEFDINDLQYGKIVIASDMDVDGDKICALLCLMFANWPELFDNNIICRSVSPIIIARKGKNCKKYYKIEDFKKDEKQLKGYTFKYTKGLAGLSNEESKEMYHEPIFHYFKLDDMSESMFRKWFNKDDSDTRKQMLND